MWFVSLEIWSHCEWSCFSHRCFRLLLFAYHPHAWLRGMCMFCILHFNFPYVFPPEGLWQEAQEFQFGSKCAVVVTTWWDLFYLSCNTLVKYFSFSSITSSSPPGVHLYPKTRINFLSQLGISSGFSLVTFVFSHNEKIYLNCTHFCLLSRFSISLVSLLPCRYWWMPGPQWRLPTQMH